MSEDKYITFGGNQDFWGVLMEITTRESQKTDFSVSKEPKVESPDPVKY